MIVFLGSRKGISEPEFNKLLESIGFSRIRVRMRCIVRWACNHLVSLHRLEYLYCTVSIIVVSIILWSTVVAIIGQRQVRIFMWSLGLNMLPPCVLVRCTLDDIPLVDRYVVDLRTSLVLGPSSYFNISLAAVRQGHGCLTSVVGGIHAMNRTKTKSQRSSVCHFLCLCFRLLLRPCLTFAAPSIHPSTFCL